MPISKVYADSVPFELYCFMTSVRVFQHVGGWGPVSEQDAGSRRCHRNEDRDEWICGARLQQARYGKVSAQTGAGVAGKGEGERGRAWILLQAALLIFISSHRGFSAQSKAKVANTRYS